MSTKAKVSMLIAFLLLVITVALQVMTGMWINLNWVLVGVSVAFVVLGIAFDWKMYWEFLTMRTTKHGMNMGAMILLVVTLLVCVNYLANRNNKTWDVTEEKLNSLSDQSLSVLKGLQGDMEIKVFFKGGTGSEERLKVKQNLQAYQEASSKLKVRFINSYVDTEAALKYLNDQPDRDASPIFVFVEYKGKKIRAEQPFDEAAFTSAMIKATRSGESKIYFVRGHGEKEIDFEGDQGLRQFVRALEESSFKVEALNLVEKKEIPKDASVIAIVGPVMPYLEEEVKWLRDYVREGGKLFIALDPGQRHNLANLTKTLGVQFENNFVLTRLPLEGWGPAGVLGLSFDPASEITRSFPTGAAFSLFHLASEVKVAADKPADIEAKELVKSDANSFTLTDPTKPIRAVPQTSAVTVAVSAEGKLPEATKAFEAVIFGDSDFISNRGMAVGVNRDLALNSIAQLADQADLISIRPKLPKGTMVVLTGFQKLAVVILGLTLPLLLLISAGVIWFKRRGA